MFLILLPLLLLGLPSDRDDDDGDGSRRQGWLYSMKAASESECEAAVRGAEEVEVDRMAAAMEAQWW